MPMQIYDIQVVPTTRPDGGNDMRLLTWNLTAAELRSLNSSPVTLISAKGVGTAIIPLSASLQYKAGTIAFTFDTSPFIGYSVSNELLSFGSILFSGLNSRVAVGALNSGGVLQSLVENAALLLAAAQNPSGSTADGTARLTLFYYVASLRG